MDKNRIEENLYNKNISTLLINFSSENSIKIIPFFQKISKGELDDLLITFSNYGVNLRIDDLLGKLHIVILKIFLSNNDDEVLIVNSVGFTPESIDFLKENMNILLKEFINKSVMVTDDTLD